MNSPKLSHILHIQYMPVYIVLYRYMPVYIVLHCCRCVPASCHSFQQEMLGTLLNTPICQPHYECHDHKHNHRNHTHDHCCKQGCCQSPNYIYSLVVITAQITETRKTYCWLINPLLCWCYMELCNVFLPICSVRNGNILWMLNCVSPIFYIAMFGKSVE